jgi:hypothetical protein
MTRALPLLLFLLVACGEPMPVLGEDLPSDLMEVVEATLETVEGEAPAHADCLPGLVIRHAWRHDDRASYDPDTSTITLRVPSTARRLEFSLAHEIAHHLEFACPDQIQIQDAFLETQGLDPGTDWFAGERWEDIPSEQFATAFAQVVTGGTDGQRRVQVTDESVALVDAWAKGEFKHEP